MLAITDGTPHLLLLQPYESVLTLVFFFSFRQLLLPFLLDDR